MCDYSLTGIPNRLAVEGEELVTHRFQTGSIGMASANDVRAQVDREEEQRQRERGLWKTFKRWLAGPAPEPLCAVCIAPGTSLVMMRVPEELRRQYALNAIEDVTFTQLTAQPFQYRDAIQFRTGRHILLHLLKEGLMFKVTRDVAERENSEMRGERGQNQPAEVRYITK